MPSQAYSSPHWLPGGQLQTLYAYFISSRPAITYRRERWDTPDGDFIDVDWVDGDINSPLLVLFHGFEGNSRSPYARHLMGAARQKNWRGAVVHFRGCSGELNRMPRAYHSGDSAEIDWILRRMKSLKVVRDCSAAASSNARSSALTRTLRTVVVVVSLMRMTLAYRRSPGQFSRSASRESRWPCSRRSRFGDRRPG